MKADLDDAAIDACWKQYEKAAREHRHLERECTDAYDVDMAFAHGWALYQLIGGNGKRGRAAEEVTT